MERIYLERVLDNALQLEGEWDYVVMHDPQPAAMREFVRGAPAIAPETRSGSGAATSTSPTRTRRCGSSSGRSSSSTTRRCGRCRSSCPTSLLDGQHRDRAAVHRPAVGEEPRAARSVRRGDHASSTACAPKIRSLVQVSRFDPWKDPIGVIEAFRIVRERVPDAQLVLAGSMATDDPRASTTGSSPNEARAGDPNIHLLSNIQQVGAVQINAFQRAADVVMQKSLREGFGLTVSEGLWKGRPGRRRPVRRDHAADRRRRERLPRRRRRDGRERAAELLARSRPRPTRWARRAASTCAATSCSTRELEDWLRRLVRRDLAVTESHDRRLASRPVPVRPRATTARSPPAGARAAS